MIKVVNLVALLVAPLVVTAAAPGAEGNRALIVIIMFVLLGVILWAVARSKRSDPETEKMVEAVAKSGAD
jgi:hypothetical protein